MKCRRRKNREESIRRLTSPVTPVNLIKWLREETSGFADACAVAGFVSQVLFVLLSYGEGMRGLVFALFSRAVELLNTRRFFGLWVDHGFDGSKNSFSA